MIRFCLGEGKAVIKDYSVNKARIFFLVFRFETGRVSRNHLEFELIAKRHKNCLVLHCGYMSSNSRWFLDTQHSSSFKAEHEEKIRALNYK